MGEVMNPGGEILDLFRTFISLLRLREYEISTEVATEVEQEFAQQRQQAHMIGAPKMTQEDLFSQLSLARFACLLLLLFLFFIIPFPCFLSFTIFFILFFLMTHLIGCWPLALVRVL